MIGNYVFTSLIFLPVFESQMQGTALRDLLERVSSRLRPYFGGSLLIFMITGTHLMMINKSYLGLGNFFGNLWSILIVIKHVLVLAFLVLAIYSERVFLTQISDEKPEALKKIPAVIQDHPDFGIAHHPADLDCAGSLNLSKKRKKRRIT